MQSVATALWVAGLACAVIATALDRVPTHLKHGGPWYAFTFFFIVPIGIAFATVATELPWWVVTLIYTATLVLAGIFTAAKREVA